MSDDLLLKQNGRMLEAIFNRNAILWMTYFADFIHAERAMA